MTYIFHFRKNLESTLLVPPLNYPKEGVYHPVYFIPEHLEQCIFATEVSIFRRIFFKVLSLFFIMISV